MPVTQRQIDLLAPWLEGDHPTHNNVDKDTGETTREWNLVCPLHNDHRRSASLNIDKGLFYCFRCGGMPITALLRRREEWVPPRLASNGNRPNLGGRAPDAPTRQLTDGMVAGWHSALMSNAGALQWLRERRGLSIETLDTYQIGWDASETGWYTIPVYDEDGMLVNIRYYNPSPGQRRKIWSEKGYGSPPRLYPMSVLLSDADEIGILAGEWDTLLALQNGFTAVTRTAGENHWAIEWGRWFKDKITWICQDMDEEGQKSNIRIARALEAVTKHIRIVKLPYTVKPKHGEDVTDVLLDFGPDKLQRCIDAGRPWGKLTQPDDEIETISVVDTADAARVGKPVRVVVMVKGHKVPGYVVPHKVSLTCTQDAGNKCTICPMRAAQGEAQIEIGASDPLLLDMLDAGTSHVQVAVATSFGVPGGKCNKLTQTVEEHQPVEILFAGPAMDFEFSDTDERAAHYRTMRITSVGRYDTPPSNTVAVIGALHPNPRTQANEFLAHELKLLETSIDRFELNGSTVALMKRFQSERPLHKLANISKNLSEHVTHIHGRTEMHALMDLTWHSVLSFKFAGEVVIRGWLESLIVGDTRTGKSLAAQRLTHHYGGGEIISCEAATFAGVVGGVQQLNGREWVVTWGVVPINDRRLVVMDEISGLTPEEIAQMSDIRSSGQAKLIKVAQDKTWARTRLLWLGNPRNATMAHYTYGVDAIKPLIGNAEDIARFDLAMALTLADVPITVINQPAGAGELVYTSEACHALLMWAWTRQPDQVVWAPGAEEAVFERATEMGMLYIEDPPLIQAANVRIKIARIAVALAARTFSTDGTCEQVIVRKHHVEAAVQFINLLYEMPTFGYRERSREQLNDRMVAEGNKQKIGKYLKQHPMLSKFLRTAGKFRRQDLEEIMNLNRDEANAVIATLYEHRMVRKQLGDIFVEPTLHSILREAK